MPTEMVDILDVTGTGAQPGGLGAATGIVSFPAVEGYGGRRLLGICAKRYVRGGATSLSVELVTVVNGTRIFFRTSAGAKITQTLGMNDVTGYYTLPLPGNAPFFPTVGDVAVDVTISGTANGSTSLHLALLFERI